MNLRQSICEVIEMIADAVSQKLSDDERKAKTKMWHIGLNDISDKQIWIGLEKFAKQPEKFFPSPGQFRELCISDGLLVTIEDEASKAWSLIMENLSYVKTTIFKNTIISEAIREMGGWLNLCQNMNSSEEPFRKKEFIGIYQSVKKRGGSFNPLLEGQFNNYRQHIGFNNQIEIDEVEEKLLIENETVKQIARL